MVVCLLDVCFYILFVHDVDAVVLPSVGPLPSAPQLTLHSSHLPRGAGKGVIMLGLFVIVPFAGLRFAPTPSQSLYIDCILIICMTVLVVSLVSTSQSRLPLSLQPSQLPSRGAI